MSRLSTLAHHQVGPFSGENTESVLDEEYVGAIGQGNTQWFWTELE
jgi:hypothetical protein